MSPEVQQHIVPHRVQLTKVLLKELECKLYSDEALDHLDVSIKAEADGKVVSDTEGHCSLTLDIAAKQGDRQAVGLRLTIAGHCSTEPGSDAQGFREFVANQALALLFPFTRELVANITMRMGLSPLLIPLIDVFQTSKNIERSRESNPTGKSDD
ncbi:MAG TPA: protein-export chaperone SecB [Bacillota bacterium]|jgi:preprotein translocase subunit SecB